MLNKIFNHIHRYVGQIDKKEFAIKVRVDRKRIREKGIHLLYYFLNNYEDYYFITIENAPYCLMPDAAEHLTDTKDEKISYCYDAICDNCDHKQECSGWAEFPFIDRKEIKPFKNIPKEVVIEITTRCNLNCLTCTIDNSKNLEVKVATVKRIFRQCKRLGIRAVRFTGGEPLLNKDLKTMLALAKKNNFYVLLNTNATDINNSLLKLLEKTVDNVLISLQGFNQRSDRALTNSSVEFEKKIANIIKIKKVIPVVRIGTVISKTLMENFRQYWDLLRVMGIDNWELYRPILKNKDAEFNISKEDLLRIMGRLADLKRAGMKVKIANPVPFCFSKNMGLSSATLLGAIADDGHSRIVWDAKGYFKPSYFINKKLSTMIDGAWNSPFLKKIRLLAYLPLKCKKCYYLKWCKGGSRAIAKMFKNDYFSEDPLM
jgi:radical SAM protein with 4Fe4S-binding SPASM domain